MLAFGACSRSRSQWHCFDNADLRFENIKVQCVAADTPATETRASIGTMIPPFLPRPGVANEDRCSLVPVELEDVANEPLLERLLSAPDEESLCALLQSMWNDLCAPNDNASQRRLLGSVRPQMQRHCDIERSYAEGWSSLASIALWTRMVRTGQVRLIGI